MTSERDPAPNDPSLLDIIQQSEGWADRLSRKKTPDSPAFPGLPEDLTPPGIQTRRDVAAIRQMGIPFPLSEDDISLILRALDYLQQKITRVAEEFNAGRINQDQYEAIFIHYGEQVAILQQLVARKRLAGPWQQSTDTQSRLRKAYAAHVVGYVLCHNARGQIIQTAGEIVLDEAILTPILNSLSSNDTGDLPEGQRCTQIEGGQWLCIIPGQMTTTLVLYSREPSENQLDRAITIQQVFEEVNAQVLDDQEMDGSWLLYPQQDLFENQDN